MYSNGALLNPEENTLIIDAKDEDVTFFRQPEGTVTILVTNFRGGIEIVDSDTRVWRPV